VHKLRGSNRKTRRLLATVKKFQNMKNPFPLMSKGESKEKEGDMITKDFRNIGKYCVFPSMKKGDIFGNCVVIDVKVITGQT
jgi:hypothetical protein